MNEEFERRWERQVEFLLSQQAKFDADMRRLEKAQEKTEQRMNQATENILHLGAFIHEGFGLTLNLFKASDAKMKELAESQKLTDENLRNLADLLDRHRREDHQGDDGAQN